MRGERGKLPLTLEDMRSAGLMLAAGLVVAAVLLGIRARSGSAKEDRGAETVATAPLPQPRVLAGSPRPHAGTKSSVTRPPENEAEAIRLALVRSRERGEQLYRRFPDLREKLLAGFRVEAAIRLGEFFSLAGIQGEQRERLLDLLAEEMEAPNRGELGERETEKMRELLGVERYEQMRAFEKLEPGIRRADEITAHLRDSKIELGEAEAGFRELAAATTSATSEINRRIYLGTPISEAEEQQLIARARAKFDLLRVALSSRDDKAAAQALDAWIERKIASELQFTKQVLAVRTQRSR